MPAQPELAELLAAAVACGASDVHLTVGCPPVVRIDGELGFVRELGVLTAEDTRRYADSIMTPRHRERLAQQRDLDLPLSLGGVSRFRTNVYYQRGCIALAIRVIPKNPPSLDELGLPPAVRSLVNKRRGLVLVTGPTGVGKTTTLAAIIEHINQQRRCHIVTIEDPIEYLYRHGKGIVNQREVLTDVASFAAGLRSVLREDPDVILVGEMRDPETTATAITAAETGHLVLASMHTRDAASTIERIIDQFPPYQQPLIRSMLAGNIEAIAAQQLVRRKEGKGRVAAVEAMIATPAVRNIIREGKTHMLPSVIETSSGEGMQTMDQALHKLYLAGAISKAEALSRASNPRQMEKHLGG